jgi:hypothetical protein
MKNIFLSSAVKQNKSMWCQEIPSRQGDAGEEQKIKSKKRIEQSEKHYVHNYFETWLVVSTLQKNFKFMLLYKKSPTSDVPFRQHRRHFQPPYASFLDLKWINSPIPSAYTTSSQSCIMACLYFSRQPECIWFCFMVYHFLSYMEF